MGVKGLTVISRVLTMHQIIITVTQWSWFKISTSFHPNIIMFICLGVLCAVPRVLTRRIFLSNQDFVSLVIISFILVTLMYDSGLIL